MLNSSSRLSGADVELFSAMSVLPLSSSSTSEVRDELRITPIKLSPPQVVAVMTVDAMVDATVLLMTLVGKLDIPSVSPRVARVEIPCTTFSGAGIGLRRMDSKLEILCLELRVGAVLIR